MASNLDTLFEKRFKRKVVSRNSDLHTWWEGWEMLGGEWAGTL